MGLGIPIEVYPDAPADTRRSSEIREAWGTPPPQKIDRVKFEFWDGTELPGGVNRLAAEALYRLDEVFRSHRYELSANADDWCYNRRKIKGSDRWSLHSWGTAVDINSLENLFARDLVTTFTPQLVADVQAIKHMGRTVWAWGGHWGRYRGHRYDAMHWQLNLFPFEAAAMRPPDVLPVLPDAAGIDDRLKVVERQVAVLRVFADGADERLKVAWVWRALIGGWPNEAQVTELMEHRLKGQSVVDVFDSIRAIQRKVEG